MTLAADPSEAGKTNTVESNSIRILTSLRDMSTRMTATVEEIVATLEEEVIEAVTGVDAVADHGDVVAEVVTEADVVVMVAVIVTS